MDREECLAALLVVMLIIPIIPVAAQNSYEFIVDSLYDSDELLPDPFLSDTLHYEEVGSSGEFTFDKEIDTDGTQIAVLNWTHLAGTYLEYDTNPFLPVCQEYVYLYQEIEWTHTNIPISINVSLNYQVNASGNFLYDNWPGLFELQVWVINSEGHEILTRFYWGHTGYQTNWNVILSSIDTIFENLQEQTKIAFVLTPSWRFLDNLGDYPWEYYNGSVIVRIKDIHIDAMYRETENGPKSMPSIANNTWRSGESERFQDSDLGKDGNLYILTYQEDDGFPVGTSLTKVNQQCEILWQRTRNGTGITFWKDMAIYDDYIYAIRERSNVLGSSIVIDKISLEGVIDTDNWMVTLNQRDYAGCITTDSEGFIYLGTYTSPQQERNNIVKLDSNGEILWTQAFGQYQYDTIGGLEVDSLGNVYAYSDHLIVKYSSDGEKLWEKEILDASVYILGDGSIIITRAYSLSANMTMLDADGRQLWTKRTECKYTPSWRESAYYSWVHESPEGLLYVLYTTFGYHTSSTIIVMNRQGRQLFNYSVAFSNEPFNGIDISRFRRIHITENNVLFLVGRIMDYDWSYDVTVSIYGAEEQILGVPTTAIYSTVGTLSFLAIAIVVLQRTKHP